MCIDGYNVTAEFIFIDKSCDITVPADSTQITNSLWYSNHVRESQYLLQVKFNFRDIILHFLQIIIFIFLFYIVKCDDKNCCTELGSNIRQILYQRFLPGPFPLAQPLHIPSPGNHSSQKFTSLLLRQSVTLRPEYPRIKEIPYDLYCPSVKDEMYK